MSVLNWLYKGLNYIYVKSCNNMFIILFKIQLKLNKIIYGKNLKTYGGIPMLKISRGADKIIIGNNVTFNNYHNTSWFCKCFVAVSPGARLSIGNNTGMNGVMIYCSKSITIGNHVNIGGGTKIYDTNFHSIFWQYRRNSKDDILNTKKAEVIIEDDAFIGTNCIIGKGITIGARSIIGAGSVVTCNIPSDEIWAGNPAKFIKKIV